MKFSDKDCQEAVVAARAIAQTQRLLGNGELAGDLIGLADALEERLDAALSIRIGDDLFLDPSDGHLIMMAIDNARDKPEDPVDEDRALAAIMATKFDIPRSLRQRIFNPEQTEKT